MAKDNQFEKDFYARIKEENGRLEKNENDIVILIHNTGGEFTPELLMDFPKCDIGKLWMIKQKSRDFIVNYVLSDEEKRKIEEIWHSDSPNANDLNVITRKISGDPKSDGRSKLGRAIRAFLASKEFNYKTITIEKLPEIILDEEQKEFIRQRCWKFRPWDITKEFYSNPQIQSLSREVRAFEKYAEEIKGNHVDKNISEEFKDIEDDGIDDSNKSLECYRPPNGKGQVVARINKYLHLDWDVNKLAKEEAKQVEILRRFLRTHNFINQINVYRNAQDRDSFEGDFIGQVLYERDITYAEMQQYIVLSSEKVNGAFIERELQSLRDEQKRARDEQDKTFSQTAYTEAVNAFQSARENSLNRWEKLNKQLMTGRKERIDARREENASVLNLVNAWKDEEFRIKTIHLAELEKVKLEETIMELSSMDSLKALIRGATEKELLSS